MKHSYETYIRSYYTACRVGMGVVYGVTEEREREKRQIHVMVSVGVIIECDCGGSEYMSEVYS